MQATNSQLTDFIGAAKQYCIPIFQRPYSWGKNDVKKLFEDILSIADDKKRPCHFIGSVIYLPTTPFVSQITRCYIIDGQQRLTTLSLTLLALADYSREYYSDSDYKESSTRYEQISELYLINKFGKGELKYKLKLSGDDFQAYKKLIEIQEKKESSTETVTVPVNLKNCLVFRNFDDICRLLKRRRINPEKVIEGIGKLLLVDIPLNPDDNAQLVFETVNSTGKPLTEAQKIKNFILMTVPLDKQDELYEECWHPMEKNLSETEFDTFFRYYMTVKLKAQINNSYYDSFKEYVTDCGSDTMTIVQEIKRFHEHYLRWKNAEKSDNVIDVCISQIKSTEQNKVTPVILKVLDDIKNKRCSFEDAKKVLTVIESYWMRRAICALPTNTAGAVCFTMLKNLGKPHYYQDFIKAIHNLTMAQRIPKDDEMKKTLYEVSIYGKSFARKLLDRMEAHENKEYSHSSNHSIEHIMPQTIQSHEELYARTDLTDSQKERIDWAIDLGENWQEIHEKYLNTIGNLTLTGFNPEYQNFRFQNKKEMKNGYKESTIRLTSLTLANLEKWGEEEIRNRSEIMSEIICDIWKYPL